MNYIDYTGTETLLSVIDNSTKKGGVYSFLNGVVIYPSPMSISFDYGRTWKSIGLDSDPTFVYEPETEDDLDVMIFTYGKNKHYIAFNDGNVCSLEFLDLSSLQYLQTTIYDKGFFINKKYFIVQLGDKTNTVMYWFDASDIKNQEAIGGRIVLYVVKYTSMPEPMELKHYDSTSVENNKSYWCSYSKSVRLFFNKSNSYFSSAPFIYKAGVGNSVNVDGFIIYVSLEDNYLYADSSRVLNSVGEVLKLPETAKYVRATFICNKDKYIIIDSKQHPIDSSGFHRIFQIWKSEKYDKAICGRDATYDFIPSITGYLDIRKWKWQGIELFMLEYDNAAGDLYRVYNSPGTTKVVQQKYYPYDFNIPDGYFPNGTPYKIELQSFNPFKSVFKTLTGSYLTRNGGLHNVTPVKGSNQTQQLRKINGDYSSAFVKDISPCLVVVNTIGVKEMYKICKDYDVVKGSLRVYDKTGTKGIVYGTTSYITQPTFVGYKERPDISAGLHSLKELASILVNYIPSGTTRAMRPIKQGSDYIEDIFPKSYHFEGPLIGLYSISLVKVESSAATVGIYYELRFNYINAGNGVYSSASDKTIVHSNVYKTFNGGNFKFDVGVKFI